MTCSHKADCPLFAQFAMEPSLAVWKSHYCEGEFVTCARYQAALKGDAIPLTLLPNGKLIEKKEKTQEEMGGTALFNAILKNRASMVKSMITSHMSSADVVSVDGSTPLMAAASVGALEIVKILLESGCNPYRTNNNGIKALDVARKKNFEECAEVIQIFMETHPHLKDLAAAFEAQKSSAIAKAKAEEEADDGSSVSEVVNLLKKLNPFSR